VRVLAAEADARRRDEVRARREMDALLYATAEGVLGMDLRGRVRTLNRAGSELLGYTEAELRGRDVHEALHHTSREGERLPRSECRILATLASRVPARSEGADVLWRKDGSPLPVQWSLRPLVEGLALRGGVLTFTDLTDILGKEEALQRAVRVREEVVSVVSHDLRNPLGVVAGAAELLLELPLDEPERRRQAEIIRRSAERMRRLIENLLDVARIEAGALVIRETAQAPEEALSEARAFFLPQAEERGVTLALAVGPGVPRVLADPDRLQQALANLVANALRFSPSGGTITLGAHDAGGGRVALTVEDPGPGIPAADLPHLFDRFWQASRHDRTGSGLGLAIVRGIAEAHGGNVEVASEPGKGARFTLLLPGVGAGGAGGEGAP
jgi:PAS domain S-box-containing protein